MSAAIMTGAQLEGVENAFQARLDAIDAAPMRPVQLVVVLLCFFLNMLDGMDVVLMTYAAPVIATEWGLRDGALGVVLTAGLVGMAAGSIALGPVADLIGRKKVVLAAVVIIAAGMIMAATANDMMALVFWRVLTGIGIGAILASMAAITAEFSNARHRTFWVAFLQGGWPIGAIITGLTSAALIETYGWRPLFVAVGLGSVVILPLVAVLMPESLQFLARRRTPDQLQRINALLRRMGQPPVDHAPTPAPNQGVPFALLLKAPLARSTYALWLAMVAGYAGLYFLISWIPKIAVDSGLPLSQAILAGSTFNAGAFIGSAGIGLLAARLPLNRLIPVFLCSSVVLMLAFGWLKMPIAVTFLLILALGVLVQGGFNALYPTAAQLYPTAVRTTGIGTAMAVGRLGAVFGPLAAGYLMQAGVTRGTLFLIYAAPLGIAGIAASIIARPQRHEVGG